jgi:ribose 5-phosphate isomerase A
MTDYKSEAAKAALQLIKKDTAVGFGAGNTVRHLIGFIKTDRPLAASITTVSSSFVTKRLLQESGFRLAEISETDRLDQYFDGCDQVDRRLNAMKSGGGIHTMEKLLASMAREFILLADESKYVKRLDATYPLVMEIIPDAIAHVTNQIKTIFPSATSSLRYSNKKDGAVITERGNYLIDVSFDTLPEPAAIDNKVGTLTGVLGHSLFYQMAHKAVVAGPSGISIVVPSAD